MDLRVLRYFLAIAREGSITRAAVSLNVTQPTLSRQIKDLEVEMGCRLFSRGSHNMILTPEGIRLRKRAEEMIELADKIKEEFNAVPEVISGDIYIGAGETQGMRLISHIIKQLHNEYPDIRYHLYSGNAEDVTERLDKGLLDFGVLIQPTDISKYDYITLPIKDVWGVLMSKECVLAKKENVSKEDLKDLPLICSRQVLKKTEGYNEFINWFGKDFEKLSIISTYNLLFNAAFLAEQEVGYVLTLDRLIENMDNRNVCFLPLTPQLESGLDIVWKKYQVFSPAAQIFLQTLRKRLGMETNENFYKK